MDVNGVYKPTTITGGLRLIKMEYCHKMWDEDHRLWILNPKPIRGDLGAFWFHVPWKRFFVHPEIHGGSIWISGIWRYEWGYIIRLCIDDGCKYLLQSRFIAVANGHGTGVYWGTIQFTTFFGIFFLVLFEIVHITWLYSTNPGGSCNGSLMCLKNGQILLAIFSQSNLGWG